MVSEYDQIANVDCTRNNLMLLFSGEKENREKRGVYGVFFDLVVNNFIYL